MMTVDCPFEGNKLMTMGKPVLMAAIITVLVMVAILPGEGSARSCFIDIRGHHLKVEVADTTEKMILGLSHREKLRDNEGMLFVYHDWDRRTFWMKDMKFDLDILWIDGDKIVRISRNARAENSHPLRIYDSNVPVNMVLEINAGLTDLWGIKEGQLIRISEK
jgi:uncharacterized membrane protein (UPF0127 family)